MVTRAPDRRRGAIGSTGHPIKIGQVLGLQLDAVKRAIYNLLCPVWKIGDAVEHPLGVSPLSHDTRLTQDGEMLRDAWLGRPQRVGKLADACLPTCRDQRQGPKAERFRNRGEQGKSLFHADHIVALAYPCNGICIPLFHAAQRSALPDALPTSLRLICRNDVACQQTYSNYGAINILTYSLEGIFQQKHIQTAKAAVDRAKPNRMPLSGVTDR